MPEKIVQLNEEVIKGQIRELVRGSVEETLNELLEKEAEQLTQAARYERSEARRSYRSGHNDRNPTPRPGTSHYTFLVSREYPLKPRSSNGIAGEKDGHSALMLVCAGLSHVAGIQWGNKKYMDMKHLEALDASLSR